MLSQLKYDNKTKKRRTKAISDLTECSRGCGGQLRVELLEIGSILENASAYVPLA